MMSELRRGRCRTHAIKPLLSVVPNTLWIKWWVLHNHISFLATAPWVTLALLYVNHTLYREATLLFMNRIVISLLAARSSLRNAPKLRRVDESGWNTDGLNHKNITRHPIKRSLMQLSQLVTFPATSCFSICTRGLAEGRGPWGAEYWQTSSDANT